MKQSNSRLSRQIRRDKKLAGAKALPAILLNVFGAIVLVFLLLGTADICLNGYKEGNLLHFLFAALQIDFPPVDFALEGQKGWHVVFFLLMGIFTTLLLPFFTAALNNLINQQIIEIQEGRKVYAGMENHCVIIGYNAFAIQLIRRMLTGNDRYAIVLTAQAPTAVRESLQSLLPEEMTERIVIYAGDAVAEEKVGTLCLTDAAEACLLEETVEGNSCYTRNLTILKNIARAAAARQTPLVLYMQINNSTAYGLFRKIDIPKSYLTSEDRYVIDLRPFNFYENWSRLLWSYHVLRKDGQCYYDPLDFEPIEHTNKHVHLVITHLDYMGVAMLLEALRICHYPNYVPATKDKKAKNKTEISVFDSRWPAMEDDFRAQYGTFEEIEDVDITFYGFDITCSEARRLVSEWAQDPAQLLTIAVCEPDPDKAMADAVNLPEAVYYQKDLFAYRKGEARADCPIQKIPCNMSRTRVLVRQQQMLTADELFAPVSTGEQTTGHPLAHPTYPNVRLFGTLAEDAGYSQLNDDVAICINGIYSEQSAKGESIFYINDSEECIANIRRVCADASITAKWRKSWFGLPENTKWANRFQVDMYKYYTDVQSRMEEMSEESRKELMNSLVEVEHRRWLAERVVAGWRQCDSANGEQRVNERRIHNCIVPFNELSEAEIVKDYNVIVTAPVLAELVTAG